MRLRSSPKSPSGCARSPKKRSRNSILIRRPHEQLGSEAALRTKIWQITDFSFEIVSALEPQFYDYIADAAYWALTRAHPQLTRPAFEEMPIGTLEMIDAIGTIAQQTGMSFRSNPFSALALGF
jgi:hypothetical protein